MHVERKSLNRLFVSFLRLGLTAFGGTAMVAYIQCLAVKKNKWLSEESLRHGVTACQFIPGATTIHIQVAAYVGLRAGEPLMLYKVADARHWGVDQVIIALIAFLALQSKIVILWVVLAGASVSALIL